MVILFSPFCYLHHMISSIYYAATIFGQTLGITSCSSDHFHSHLSGRFIYLEVFLEALLTFFAVESVYDFLVVKFLREGDYFCDNQHLVFFFSFLYLTVATFGLTVRGLAALLIV